MPKYRALKYTKQDNRKLRVGAWLNPENPRQLGVDHQDLEEDLDLTEPPERGLVGTRGPSVALEMPSDASSDRLPGTRMRGGLPVAPTALAAPAAASTALLRRALAAGRMGASGPPPPPPPPLPPPPPPPPLPSPPLPARLLSTLNCGCCGGGGAD